MLLKSAILIAIILSGCSSKYFRIQEGLETKCGEVAGTVPWKYCISKHKNVNEENVIYYLHGTNGTENAWLDPRNFVRFLRYTWKADGIKRPVVINVTLGKYWLLTSKNGMKNSGYYEIFVNEIIPKMESMLKTKPKQRMLLGVSKGGYNGAQLALKNPELFSKVALLCPMIDVPYHSEENVQSYMKKNNVPRLPMEKVSLLVGIYYPDEKTANDNSPVNLVKKGKKYPEFYISIGKRDEYGFFNGAKNLSQKLKKAGAAVTWAPVVGNHCSADAQKAARFFLPN